MPMISKKYKAFSFVEVIIIVLFLGIFAAIAVPRFNRAAISKNKAQTAARRIVADLRLTRRLAISNAANNSSGFSLNIFGSSPYGYEIKNLDGGVVLETHTFDSEVSFTGGTKFEFEPLGNLSGASDTQLTVSRGGESFTISIVPATGMVKCSEN
jgi:type II secretory pathway pseudopilin PulG